MESKNRERREEEVRSSKEDGHFSSSSSSSSPPSSSSSSSSLHADVDAKLSFSSTSGSKATPPSSPSSSAKNEHDTKGTSSSSSSSSSERSATFRINWMNMRDAGNGRLMWASQQWGEALFEKVVDETIPREILTCRYVCINSVYMMCIVS